MLDILDLFLRPIGFLLALGIALSVTASWVGMTLYPILYPNALSRPIYRLLGLLVSVPVGAIVLFLTWRAIRFAAGYTGSSEYPFQFVVRLIQHFLD